jgi:hypothetical protein
MHHRDTEGTEKREFRTIKHEILGAAIEGHRPLGPRSASELTNRAFVTT